MKPEDIHITDYLRILLGEVPWSFLIEVVIRVFFIYLVLTLAMRLMGKRMAARLSRSEMAALVALAASNGVAILAPDRGLLPVFIIALVIICFQKFIALRTRDNPHLEQITMGDVDVLIKDGVLQLECLQHTRMSQEQVFAQCRFEQISNLGKVKRAYLEANGAFTILKDEEKKAGLSILPNWDKEFRNTQQAASDTFACCNCGNIVTHKHQAQNACSVCGEKEWSDAVVS
ncbi:DUF421 domain-containing protein [Adhaeribacter radiodurans]|uniref:DUF421 domain-containing protein n=1 Tax=Adhaeribacter radiodurans TaxID=2745197 RepID=A0A7L7L7B3_9BACT|nr:YetF domain-containing protein [Adhaeribacter radiodurans]QMU28732.1 DUF421 domain-containing protein [Adhaeribacter radiodurans]